MLLVKSGYPLDSEDDYYDSEAVTYQYKSECEYRNGCGFSGHITLQCSIAIDEDECTRQATY